MSRITMQEVAEKAGVSMKTVSRVINNEQNVRKTTRDKVFQTIEELDFQPNMAARNLAADRSFLLGLLYDNPSSAYTVDLQNGSLKTCHSWGYSLLIHPCDSNDKAIYQNIDSLIKRTRMDGVILTPPLSDDQKLLDNLDERNIKYVRVSPLAHNDRSPYVFVNEDKAAYDMTQHLISLGHERIGFITGISGRSGTKMRLEGYRSALKDNGITIKNELVQQGQYSFESGEQCARKLLKLANRPTAIFASNDYMAAGVMKIANQMKIKVPFELSVCGYDDAPIAHHIWPGLTTIKNPVEQLSALATDHLIHTIKKQPLTVAPSNNQYQLIIRESTGPRML